MNLYVESSAVLSWLLTETASEEVREELASSELVLSSELTLIECDRVLIRAVTTHEITEAEAADRRAILAKAAEHWTLLTLDVDIVERARRPFPKEPVRTLDAIHLATAVVARSLVPEIAMLSLDKRIRGSARELGFEVIPVQ